MGPELSERPSGAHAQARARAYGLLARLMGSSLRELEAARLEPRMRAAIDGYADRDALAADHQHVLGGACSPFASVVLDAGARLGGETSDRVREALARVGIAEGPAGEEPDHLAAQLHALALLSGAEADAIEDGEDEIALRMRAATRHLLDGVVLRYLPILAMSVRRSARPWPTALIDTLEELVLHHRSTLGAPDPADLDLELPPLALSLDDESTDLSAISTALARAARAGFFLTRDDLAALGRETSTPRGFGDRATELENLLRGAAELGSWRALIDRIDALASAVGRELAGERLSDVPEALRAPFRDRIEETRALLGRLRDAQRDAG